MVRSPLAVSFGGGRDGSALLCEMRKRGIRPDRIQFSDTGNRDAEKPETYEHVDRMSKLTLDWWGVPITWVRNDGMYKTLENNCLSKHMLPSLVYGFKSCSDKYKHRPMEKDIAQWEPAIECWKSGGKVIKVIGYNASEPHRALNITEDARYIYRYFLVEWGITSAMVADICQRELGYVPHKSACWFCPASKKSEVIWLKNTHPDLYERALRMESNAAENLSTVKGLGRSWSWADLGRADDQQFKMFPETIETPCMCFDGGDDE
jgi:hypothetical protein